MSFQITPVLFGREVYASWFMIICHWRSDELKLSWERIRKHSCTREGNPNHTVPLQTSALHTFMHSIPGVLQEPGKLRFHRCIKTDKVSAVCLWSQTRKHLVESINTEVEVLQEMIRVWMKTDTLYQKSPLSSTIKAQKIINKALWDIW